MNKDSIRVDMHIHSTASDGTWTSEVLVNKVKEAEINIFSVTDHDSVENTKEIGELAKINNLVYISGVELSSNLDGQWIHILGYDANIDDKKFEELVKNNADTLIEVDDDGVVQLEKVFDNITFEEYEKYENNPLRGGWKAINYLIDKGICEDVRSFFSIFPKLGLKLSEPKFLHPEIVIDTIVKAGGVAILAHPGSYNITNNFESLENFLYKMRAMGINGIECYHFSNNEEVTKRCVEWCKLNNMLITGGSDCHGEFETNRKLLEPEIYLDMLNLGHLIKK